MSRRATVVLVVLLANAMLYGLLVIPSLRTIAWRDAEMERLREKVTTLEEEINTRDMQLKEETETRIKLEIALTPRMKTEEEQYRETLRTFLSVRTGSLHTISQELRLSLAHQELAEWVNPPPEEVTGKVKAVDAEFRMVAINLGSDSGLFKGSTLRVYRPGYPTVSVGIFRVMDTRPNEAVGKMLRTGGRTIPVQVGDLVTSVQPDAEELAGPPTPTADE